MAIAVVWPETIVGGSELRLRGQGFVGETLGLTRVRFQGTHTADAGGAAAVDVALLARVESSTELAVPLGTGFASICPGGDGTFDGTLSLEVASRATERVYATSAIRATLICRTALTPTLTTVDVGGHTLNAEVPLVASDVLLGGAEGGTTLQVQGCFLPATQAGLCTQFGQPVGPVRLPIVIGDAATRTGSGVVLAPKLSGLQPGTLAATVHLVNRDANGNETTSGALPWTIEVLPSQLTTVEAAGASLGGYVEFSGAGFVGGAPDEGTEILLQGSFTADGSGAPVALDLILVTEFVDGGLVRYVLDEQDSLGQRIDLRGASGTVSASFLPRMYQGASQVVGAGIEATFRIEPLRQVVWLNFTQEYVDALASFGLRAARSQIADRARTKIATIYAGINVEVRLARPEDYRLFAQVDITAIDPNGYGLLGYDNTPGKDVGNLRLYDHIGGLNAATQQDGYPGYGGVFLQSFWAFSLDPPIAVDPLAGASPRFDDVFDPLRPDRGEPLTEAEAAALAPRTAGDGCDGLGPRADVAACAVFVLGNLLGGTIAHELAHSFGLADPTGSRFHNPGDGPGRLLDAGGDRPFAERAELDGAPPEHLCRENYDYLAQVMPTGTPDPLVTRPTCD